MEKQALANPSIALPKTLLAGLDAAARDLDMNRSQAIREAIRTWLRLKGYPVNPTLPSEKAS